MTSLYTIGHSNRSFEHFAELLRQHHVATLVDVRSRPYSKHVPHFQKRPLSDALTAIGVRYVFLGDKLGGKLENQDYSMRARAPDFQTGVEELIAIADANATAIMCAEEDPRRCHRRLLVTPVLVDEGVEVLHIRGDGTLEPEANLRCEASQLPLFRR